MNIKIVSTLLLLFVAKSWADEEIRGDPKMFSLFSVVTFKNQGCKSNDNDRNGTCFTSTECTDKGGKASGNCASGFGVCCVFLFSAGGSEVSENCSYIQNPGFPSAYTETTALTYTIKKCAEDVCAVRLDFDSFTTMGPSATTEDTGGACTDSFVVTGTSGLTSPTICGKNTGQHIYMEMGHTASSTATVTFTFSGASTTRTWEIKATQIPCGASYGPPDGCLQYHTGLTGRITTFNFLETTTPQHLASQEYSICVRPEMGYCCVQYSVCSDTNSWTIHEDDGTAITTGLTDTACNLDFISIAGASGVCTPGANVLRSKFCGTFINPVTAGAKNEPVCDCNAPFTVGVHTDNTADTAMAAMLSTNRGVCLEYNQIPCQ